jgi:hypothetical protein
MNFFDYISPSNKLNASRNTVETADHVELKSVGSFKSFFKKRLNSGANKMMNYNRIASEEEKMVFSKNSTQWLKDVLSRAKEGSALTLSTICENSQLVLTGVQEGAFSSNRRKNMEDSSDTSPKNIDSDDNKYTIAEPSEDAFSSSRSALIHQPSGTGSLDFNSLAPWLLTGFRI